MPIFMLDDAARIGNLDPCFGTSSTTPSCQHQPINGYREISLVAVDQACSYRCQIHATYTEDQRALTTGFVPGYANHGKTLATLADR